MLAAWSLDILGRGHLFNPVRDRKQLHEPPSAQICPESAKRKALSLPTSGMLKPNFRKWSVSCTEFPTHSNLQSFPKHPSDRRQVV